MLYIKIILVEKITRVPQHLNEPQKILFIFELDELIILLLIVFMPYLFWTMFIGSFAELVLLLSVVVAAIVISRYKKWKSEKPPGYVWHFLRYYFDTIPQKEIPKEINRRYYV